MVAEAERRQLADAMRTPSRHTDQMMATIENSAPAAEERASRPTPAKARGKAEAESRQPADAQGPVDYIGPRQPRTAGRYRQRTEERLARTRARPIGQPTGSLGSDANKASRRLRGLGVMV